MNKDVVWIGEPKLDSVADKEITARLEELAKQTGRRMAHLDEAIADDAERFDSKDELLAALEGEVKRLNRAERRERQRKRGKGVTR